MRKRRSRTISESSENLYSTPDGGYCIVKEPRREMTGNSSRTNTRIDVKGVGSLVDIDLIEITVQRAVAFVLHRERDFQAVRDTRCKINSRTVEN